MVAFLNVPLLLLYFFEAYIDLFENYTDVVYPLESEIRPYPAGPFERPHNRSPSSTINKLTTPSTSPPHTHNNITRAPIDEAAAYWFTYYYYRARARVCVCVYYYNNNNVVITETFVACTRVEKPNRRSLQFVFVFFFTQHVYKYIIMNASRTNIGQSHCGAFDWRLKLAYLLTYRRA